MFSVELKKMKKVNGVRAYSVLWTFPDRDENDGL
jgi:hypothetical protein